MAIYHMTVKIIGRSEGRSAVAAAAYRSGDRMINQYDGVVHDYTRKGWVEHREIILPDNAPKEYSDRSTLWNSVEFVEKSADARLAREFEIALPIEFSKEQQIEVVREFASKLVAEGMIADICIHNPPVTDDRHRPLDMYGNTTSDKSKMQFRNPHAHILTTMRPIDEKGKWQAKSEVEYLCVRNGEEKGFTAKEYQIAKEQGWEKQYRYWVNKQNKIWLPASEASVQNLERVNRNPKTLKHGRKNPIVEEWSKETSVISWRKMWETIVNQKFEKMNLETRIDSRSYKGQGRDEEIPTIHMGPAAINMDKRANRELGEGKNLSQIIFSDIGSINRQIKAHNRFVRQIKAQFDAFIGKAKDFVTTISSKLESIRSKLIGNLYEEQVLTDKCKALDSILAPVGNRLTRYEKEMAEITSANTESGKRILEIEREAEECLPYQLVKKTELRKRMQEEFDKIKNGEKKLERINRKYGYLTTQDYSAAKKEYTTCYKDMQKLQNVLDTIQKDKQGLVNEYDSIKRDIQPEYLSMIENTGENLRTETEQMIQDSIRKKYGAEYCERTMKEAKRRADKLIGIRENEGKRTNVRTIR